MRLLGIFLIFIITSMGTLHAEPITENSVLHSVDRHFPLIRAARASIMKAQAEYLSAQGAFDPSIRSNLLVSPNGVYQNGLAGVEFNIPVADSGNRVFTGYRIGRGNYPPYDQDRETFNYGEVRVGVEMPFYRNRNIDDRRAKILKAGITQNISRDEYRLTKLKTNLEATISYWDWVADGRQLILQKQMLDIALQRQEALDHSVDSGDAAKIDSIDNQRIIMQRRTAVQGATATFQKSSLLLSLYYRDDSGKPILPDINKIPALSDVNGSLQPIPNSQNMIDAAVVTHPGIQLLEKRYDLAKVSLKQANNNLLPMLNNKFYLAQDLGGGNPPLNRTTINYELTFDIPFYQRDARGQIEAANNEIIKIDQERKMQSEQIVVKIKQSLAQLKAAKSISGLTQKEADMAGQVESAENIKYKNGDSNLFVLNQRELSTAEAKNRHIEAVRNYHVTLAQLNYAIGSDSIS